MTMNTKTYEGNLSASAWSRRIDQNRPKGLFWLPVHYVFQRSLGIGPDEICDILADFIQNFFFFYQVIFSPSIKLVDHCVSFGLSTAYR
jgi:hypothetical protein